MRLVFLLCQLGLILRTKAQTPFPCILSDTNRPPQNSDLNVECGTEYMDLSIFLCPVYQALYNESLLVVNNELNKPECRGIADWSSDPPVVRFRFPINESSTLSCKNNFETIDQIGKGKFNDFSRIQFMNITGMVMSVDPTAGMITYRQQIKYKFSCLYPMQYFLNNTHIGVSGVNLAIKDSNGTFISTLSMHLFKDENYRDGLTMPPAGLNLKTKIYVAVEANNLTDRFNVLLDRCYTTTSPFPLSETFYDLFVGCTRDEQTKVELNGVSQVARFSFEAFRFLEHKNQTVSTFYLHCITRLCEVSTCGSFQSNCSTSSRRKREVAQESLNTTVSSPVIVVGENIIEDAKTSSASHAASSESNYSSPVLAVIGCIVILAVLLLAMPACFALYLRQRKTIIQ